MSVTKHVYSKNHLDNHPITKSALCLHLGINQNYVKCHGLMRKRAKGRFNTSVTYSHHVKPEDIPQRIMNYSNLDLRPITEGMASAITGNSCCTFEFCWLGT